MGLMECLLSQRVVLILVSSLILLCGRVLVQSAPKRMKLPDFGTRDGVAILDPNVGDALTREHVLAHNRVGRQRSVVMRRNTKTSSSRTGAVSKSATGSTSESSVDDPIEILKRTARVLVAAKKRNPSGGDRLDPVLGKQLVDIYHALANIYRSREQHFESFHMEQLADETAAEAHLELEDVSAD